MPTETVIRQEISKLLLLQAKAPEAKVEERREKMELEQGKQQADVPGYPLFTSINSGNTYRKQKIIASLSQYLHTVRL